MCGNGAFEYEFTIIDLNSCLEVSGSIILTHPYVNISILFII